MHYTQVRLARIIEGSLKSLQSRKTQFPVSQNADAAHYRQIMRRQSWWELPISRILGSFALFSPISSEKMLKLNHPIPSIQVTFIGQAFEGTKKDSLPVRTALIWCSLVLILVVFLMWTGKEPKDVVFKAKMCYCWIVMMYFEEILGKRT